MKQDAKLPDKWINCKLSDICSVNQGLQIPIAKRLNSPSDKSLVYITVQYLNGGSEAQYIEDFNDNVVCDASDILMTRTGNTGLVVTGVRGVFHNNFFKVKYDKNQVDRKYFVCFFRSEKIQYRIRVLAGSSTIPDLNHGDFFSIKILLPLLPEQKAIADLLSTWDKAIEKTERLIQAKEKRFKWLLRSFISDQSSMSNEKWKTVKLGEVGNPYSGLTGKTKNDFGSGKPYLPYLNVYQNFRVNSEILDYVNVTEGENQRHICKGDVFFTVSSETPDEVGISSVLLDDLGECYLNSFCFGWRPVSNELLPEYLQFYFRSAIFRKQMIRLAQGATRFNLSKTELMKAYILFPSIKEQQQIADTLSTTQQEIDLLKQLAEKYKTQKRGLMQKMLTGIWRIAPDAVMRYE